MSIPLKCSIANVHTYLEHAHNVIFVGHVTACARTINFVTYHQRSFACSYIRHGCGIKFR